MKNRQVTSALIIALAACSPDISERREIPLVKLEAAGDMQVGEAVHFVDV